MSSSFEATENFLIKICSLVSALLSCTDILLYFSFFRGQCNHSGIKLFIMFGLWITSIRNGVFLSIFNYLFTNSSLGGMIVTGGWLYLLHRLTLFLVCMIASRAAKTIYHQWGGLKQGKCILSQLWRPEAQNQGVGRAVLPLRLCGGILPRPFQLLMPLRLLGILWFVMTSFHLCLFPPVAVFPMRTCSLLFSSLLLKTPVIGVRAYLNSAWPHLNQLHQKRPHFQIKSNNSEILKDISFWGIMQPTTLGIFNFKFGEIF